MFTPVSQLGNLVTKSGDYDLPVEAVITKALPRVEVRQYKRAEPWGGNIKPSGAGTGSVETKAARKKACPPGKENCQAKKGKGGKRKKQKYKPRPKKLKARAKKGSGSQEM